MLQALALPRRQELERCFKQYRDVPAEVVVKEDILSLGIRFSEAALKAAVGYRRKSYYLFSYNRSSFLDMKKQESRRAPEEIRIQGGPYDIKPTVISVRLSSESPYKVDRNEEGGLMLFEGDFFLADVEYRPEPEWYKRKLPDGTPYGHMVADIGWGERTLSMVMRHCQMWDDEQQCLYCDLVANVNAMQSMDWPVTIRKKPENVATVFHSIFRERDDGELLPTGIQLTGGSLIDHEAGHIGDCDFYISYVSAIKDKVGNRWPLTQQTAALDEAATRVRIQIV